MNRRVTRSSWSIETHPSWRVEDDPECLTLTKSDETGAFQLSSVMKEAGSITQLEVKQFASEETDLMGVPSPVKFTHFLGFEVSYSEKGIHWHRYWLANSNILVFATYNGSSANWDSEKQEVIQMLNTIDLNS